MKLIAENSQKLCNLDVIERLSAAWNPPDVSGNLCLVPGCRGDVLHLCFKGQSGERHVTMLSCAMEDKLFRNPQYRSTLERDVRDYLDTALETWNTCRQRQLHAL